MAIINQHPAFKKKSGIRKVPVNNSSFVSHFQYDSDNMQLLVVLKDGGEYLYDQVDSATVDQFIESPSKGQFFSKYIKGKYTSTRLIDKTVGPRGGKHGNGREDTRTDKGGRS